MKFEIENQQLNLKEKKIYDNVNTYTNIYMSKNDRSAYAQLQEQGTAC
jgi:hypothetical protein